MRCEIQGMVRSVRSNYCLKGGADRVLTPQNYSNPFLPEGNDSFAIPEEWAHRVESLQLTWAGDSDIGE